MSNHQEVADALIMLKNGEAGQFIAAKYTKTRIGFGLSGGPAWFLASPNHGDFELLMKDLQNIATVLNGVESLQSEIERLRAAVSDKDSYLRTIANFGGTLDQARALAKKSQDVKSVRPVRSSQGEKT